MKQNEATRSRARSVPFPRAQEPELPLLIGRLLDTFKEELRQNQRLLAIVRLRKDSSSPEALARTDFLLRAEREVLTSVVTVERDRISLVTELGQILGHPDPSRLRIAEIILHADEEARDELLEVRDEFRDVAEHLEDLIAVNPIFSRHRKDQVRLYLSPSRRADVLPLGPSTPGPDAPAASMRGREGT